MKLILETRAHTFEHNGRTYTWGGGFGALFKSRERVGAGTVRVFGNTLFHAQYVFSRGPFRKPEVCWVPISEERFEATHIREIKAEIFK